MADSLDMSDHDNQIIIQSEESFEDPITEINHIESHKEEADNKTNIKLASNSKCKPVSKAEPSMSLGKRPEKSYTKGRTLSKNSADLEKGLSFAERNKEYQLNKEKKMSSLKLKIEEDKKEKSLSQMCFKRPKSSINAKSRQSSRKSTNTSNQTTSFFSRMTAPIERKFREREVVKPERSFKRKKYNFNSNKAYWNQINLPFKDFKDRNPTLNLETLTLFFKEQNLITNSSGKDLVNKAFALLSKEGLDYNNLFYFLATVLDATNCEADKGKTLEESYLYNNEWLFDYLDKDQLNWTFVSKAEKLKKDFEELRSNWNEFDNIRIKKEEKNEKKKIELNSENKKTPTSKGKIGFVSEKDKIKAKLFLKNTFFTEEEKESLMKNGQVDLETLLKMEKRKNKHEKRQIEESEVKQREQTEQREIRKRKNSGFSKEFANRVRTESFSSNEVEFSKNKPKITPKGLSEKNVKLDFSNQLLENKKANQEKTEFISPKNKLGGASQFAVSSDFKPNKKPVLSSKSLNRSTQLGKRELEEEGMVRKRLAKVS